MSLINLPLLVPPLALLLSPSLFLTPGERSNLLHLHLSLTELSLLMTHYTSTLPPTVTPSTISTRPIPILLSSLAPNPHAYIKALSPVLSKVTAYLATLQTSVNHSYTTVVTVFEMDHYLEGCERVTDNLEGVLADVMSGGDCDGVLTGAVGEGKGCVLLLKAALFHMIWSNCQTVLRGETVDGPSVECVFEEFMRIVQGDERDNGSDAEGSGTGEKENASENLSQPPFTMML